MSKELLDHVISGAIYDFGAYLTTRENEVVFSAHHDAAPMVPLIQEFLIMRGVDQTCEPMVKDWQSRCSQLNAQARTTDSKFNNLPDDFYCLVTGEERSIVKLYTNPDTGIRGVGFGIWDGSGFLPLMDITDASTLIPVHILSAEPTKGDKDA